jgi:oxygen-dependent protoporphyrinogen oxidase
MTAAAILGGGISGLSAAYYLSKAQRTLFDKIYLLESSNRTGGWVKTLRQDDGSLFECGPRSIRGVGRAGYNTLEMVEELGLSDDVLPIPRSHVASRNRFVYVNCKMHTLPNSFASVVLPHPPFRKPLAFYGALEPFQPRSHSDDETVDSFFRRRFGPEIAEFAANPLCRGIFAGDSHKLSMRSCFPIFYNLEQQYGSIVAGSLLRSRDKTLPDTKLIRQFQHQKWSMWSLKSGLQQLPEALLQHLEKDTDAKVEIQTGVTCTNLEFFGNRAKICFPFGQLTVDHVLCALPAYVAGDLVQKQHPHLAALLNSINFASVAVVNIQYNSNVLTVQGFGHLIPSFEIPGVLGVLYESCVFPQHNGPSNSTRITVMMGGSWFEECFGDVNCCDVDHIVQTAVNAVSNHLSIRETPVRVIPHILKRCIPHYRVGHHRTLQEIAKYITRHHLPLTLIGSSYKGVSVNECIHSARVDVEQLLHSH